MLSDTDELLVLGGVHLSESRRRLLCQKPWRGDTGRLLEADCARERPVIAWVIPNSPEATEARLDAYLVSIQALEAWTGEVFPEVPDYAKWEKPEVSWLVPRGCDKG